MSSNRDVEPRDFVCPWDPEPEDTDAAIFMPRALKALAVAKFGSEWTGLEPYLNLPNLLPDCLPARYEGIINALGGDLGDEVAEWVEPPAREVLNRAQNFLIDDGERRVPFEDPLFSVAFPPISRRPSFTIKQWHQAQKLAVDEINRWKQSQGRWHELKRLFKKFCERQILEIVTRDHLGGALSEVHPASFWNTENLRLRFLGFKMDPNAPFAAGGQIESQPWIFVTTRSLKRALSAIAGENGPPAKSGTGAYVSEALAFMWEQNIQLNIDPNNPVKKEALQASLIQNWRGSEPLGKTEAGYMATFIRPRAAKTGKNSKSGKPGV